jgi:quercetin dioxygenase-like cupin family protein
MNKIKELINYYKIPVGFSSHGDPQDIHSVILAVAKGATLFEKHITIEDKIYQRNSYSTFPQEMDKWLLALTEAKKACEITPSSKKEYNDVRQFKRGVFAKEDIKKGDIINRSNVYYAWPNMDNQLVANDMSKYTHFIAEYDIKKDEPIFNNNKKINNRTQILDIHSKVIDLIEKSKIVIPRNSTLEISHHYGLNNFYDIGSSMITIVNKDYCKKYIIILPYQHHPAQYHKLKTETFHILYGRLWLELDHEGHQYNPGDVITINPNVIHEFEAYEEGCVFEEISSTHYQNDSFYIDNNIQKDRKTFVML